MRFENKKAYMVKNHTRNKTNTKDYSLLNGDFIFEADFKFESIKDSDQNEFCIVARTGYNMGIFTQGNDAIKWCWFEYDDDNDDEIKYNDIYVHPLDNNLRYKVKVIKRNDQFKLYINDKFYESKTISRLWDYSNDMIYVGVANPLSEDNAYWFNGEIYDVKIYNHSVKRKDTLYMWLDFERNTQFKTFDKSGNGNHGEIYESDEFKRLKDIEFNKTARPAKIIYIK